MATDNDKLHETYRELTAGLHKSGLAVHGLTVVQEDHGRRLNSLERVVTTNDNSLQTRVARLEDSVRRLESSLKTSTAGEAQTNVARINSRATVIAAWIGGLFGFISAVIALIVALRG